MSIRLVAILVLFLAVINLSYQQPDGHAKRDVLVDKVMQAFESHYSSNTELRKKRDIPSMELRDMIIGLLAVCFDDIPYPDPSDPCTSPGTVNLTELWRTDHYGSDIQPRDDDYNCDAYLFDNDHWFRITGDAGNMISNTCPPSYSCGSHGGIWTDARMPQEVGEVWQVELYGSWDGDCDWYPFKMEYPLTVMRCSSLGDFVYKIDGLPGCYHSVCTMSYL